jgi:hypothetical protein
VGEPPLRSIRAATSLAARTGAGTPATAFLTGSGAAHVHILLCTRSDGAQTWFTLLADSLNNPSLSTAAFGKTKDEEDTITALRKEDLYIVI